MKTSTLEEIIEVALGDDPPCCKSLQSPPADLAMEQEAYEGAAKKMARLLRRMENTFRGELEKLELLSVVCLQSGLTPLYDCKRDCWYLEDGSGRQIAWSLFLEEMIDDAIIFTLKDEYESIRATVR